MFSRSSKTVSAFTNYNKGSGAAIQPIVLQNPSPPIYINADQPLVDLYSTLSRYISSIKTLTDEYAKGDFSVVATILTQETYNKMSKELNALKADRAKYPYYEDLRRSTCSTFAGLYQSVLQYANLLHTQSELTNAREKVNILEDPVKLQEYINELKTKRSLFPESVVKTEVVATIKPEYAEYIRLYGFPAGSVFDMDKLAEIQKRM